MGPVFSLLITSSERNSLWPYCDSCLDQKLLSSPEMNEHSNKTLTKCRKISFLTGVTLSAAILVICRFRPLAELYSEKVYPVVSAALSFLASPFHFSLQGIVIPILILVLLWIIVDSVRKRQGWLVGIVREANLLVWIFVWCYLGWALNYSRSSIYDRADVQRTQYDSTVFVNFLNQFTNELNEAYIPVENIDKSEVEREVKDFFSREGRKLGLCEPKGYQHPKPMLVGTYQSWTGILGYIGPLFCESHLHPDLLPVEYPFTMAHEYSHLMGVSSEAEANWWAWRACRDSYIPEIRYSAYLSLLPHIWINAARLLSEDDVKVWRTGIRPEVVSDLRTENAFWKNKRNPVLDKFQSWMYDLFLKGNGIPTGMANYSEVVQMMMVVD